MHHELINLANAPKGERPSEQALKITNLLLSFADANNFDYVKFGVAPNEGLFFALVFFTKRFEFEIQTTGAVVYTYFIDSKIIYTKSANYVEAMKDIKNAFELQ